MFVHRTHHNTLAECREEWHYQENDLPTAKFKNLAEVTGWRDRKMQTTAENAYIFGFDGINAHEEIIQSGRLPHIFIYAQTDMGQVQRRGKPSNHK